METLRIGHPPRLSTRQRMRRELRILWQAAVTAIVCTWAWVTTLGLGLAIVEILGL